jgi:broad specificity phosphatase PhoE
MNAPEVKVWLVRHGETVWNAQHKISGWFDVELSQRGQGMARDLRPRLGQHHFDSVWSSDLQRARATAELAYGPARPDPRIRELDFGPLEGEDWTQLPAEQQQKVVRFEEDCTCGGELISQFEARVLSFIEELPAGNHLLFVHAGVIRAVLRQVQADQYVPPTTVAVINWSQKQLLELHLGPA